MFKSLSQKRAQSTAEYVVVLGLIVAAVVAMQTYIKRGFQGRIRQAVDYVGYAGEAGNGVVDFSGNQYEPYYLSSGFSTNRSDDGTQNLFIEGAVNRTSNEVTTRAGNQIIDDTTP